MIRPIAKVFSSLKNRTRMVEGTSIIPERKRSGGDGEESVKTLSAEQTVFRI